MEPTPQVGAIVFRNDRTPPRILLVRAKKDPGMWIFPKGHFAPGESDAAAALRELREEAGVAGALLGPVGTPQTFQSGDELVRVQYHLIRMTAEGPSPEGREKQWLPAREAVERLSFEAARELLKAALPEIERHATPTGAGPAGDPFAEYLRAEYKHVAESLLKSEEDGEKRATFFVTLTGAVGAALGFAMGGKQDLQAAGRHPLIIATLAVLLALGYLTFVRIVSRNVASDRFKRRLNRIRRYFLDGNDDPRLAFVPFDPYKPEPRRLWSWKRIGKGGWLETLVLVNALLLGALVALVTASPHWWVNVFVGTVSAALGWSGLMAHGTERYRREMWGAREGLILERGGLGKAHGDEERRAKRAILRLKRLGFIEMEEPGAHYGPRSRAADELLFLVEGKMTFTDIARSETVTVRPGDLLFIPAALVHRVEKDVGTRCVMGVRKDIDGDDF